MHIDFLFYFIKKRANLLLVNAIVDPETVTDREQRTTIRNQLEQGGLSQIFERMRPLNDRYINEQIEKYQRLEDYDSMSIMLLGNSLTEPHELADKIIRSTKGTKSSDAFTNIMQQLLILIQCGDSAETRNYYYKLIEHFVMQVSLDHQGLPNSFNQNYKMDVQSLIQKFAEEDELEMAFQDAYEAREMAKKAMENEAKLKVQLDLRAGKIYKASIVYLI
jgi:hypothetical protein